MANYKQRRDSIMRNCSMVVMYICCFIAIVLTTIWVIKIMLDDSYVTHPVAYLVIEFVTLMAQQTQLLFLGVAIL